MLSTIIDQGYAVRNKLTLVQAYVLSVFVGFADDWHSLDQVCVKSQLLKHCAPAYIQEQINFFIGSGEVKQREINGVTQYKFKRYREV